MLTAISLSFLGCGLGIWQYLLNKLCLHNQFICQVLVLVALPDATDRSLPYLTAPSAGFHSATCLSEENKLGHFCTQFDGVLQLPFIKGSLSLITSKELFLNQIPFQYSIFYGILFVLRELKRIFQSVVQHSVVQNILVLPFFILVVFSAYYTWK